jgi:hypothetical protein
LAETPSTGGTPWFTEVRDDEAPRGRQWTQLHHAGRVFADPPDSPQPQLQFIIHPHRVHPLASITPSAHYTTPHHTKSSTSNTHTMAPSYTHNFNHAGLKGKVEIPTGLFINNEWSTSKDSNAKTIE